MSPTDTVPAPEPRAAWWAESEPVASLDFGLAITVDDFDGAFRLLHDQYVATRAMIPDASGRRVNTHNLLYSTKLVVAKAGTRIVGTLTAVEDSRLGLPMDEIFGAELGRLRDRGRRVTEAASLAIDPDCRTVGVSILVRLLRIVVLYHARVVRAHDLCFVVHPRYREFYGRLFPFEELRGTKAYRRMAGKPVIGLRIDLALVRALLRLERAGLSFTPATAFVCGPKHADDVLGRIRTDLPRSALMPLEWTRLFAA